MLTKSPSDALGRWRTCLSPDAMKMDSSAVFAPFVDTGTAVCSLLLHARRRVQRKRDRVMEVRVRGMRRSEADAFYLISFCCIIHKSRQTSDVMVSLPNAGRCTVVHTNCVQT